MSNKLAQTHCAIGALQALAEWRAADAALAFASAQDASAKASALQARWLANVNELGHVMAGVNESGHVIDLGAWQMVMAQLQASTAHLDQVRLACSEAEEAMQGARSDLGGKRAYAEAMAKLKRGILREMQREQERAELPVLDDLVLSNRWMLESEA